MTEFRLRSDLAEVPDWAERYTAAQSIGERELERKLEVNLAPAVRECGHYDLWNLIPVAQWKSPRIVHHIKNNKPAFVAEATRMALLTKDERARYEIPTILKGVGRPMSSVLLHFAFPDRYPIIDFRAVWALGIAPYREDFEFWIDYATCCRVSHGRQTSRSGRLIGHSGNSPKTTRESRTSRRPTGAEALVGHRL